MSFKGLLPCGRPHRQPFVALLGAKRLAYHRGLVCLAAFSRSGPVGRSSNRPKVPAPSDLYSACTIGRRQTPLDSEALCLTPYQLHKRIKREQEGQEGQDDAHDAAPSSSSAGSPDASPAASSDTLSHPTSKSSPAPRTSPSYLSAASHLTHHPSPVTASATAAQRPQDPTGAAPQASGPSFPCPTSASEDAPSSPLPYWSQRVTALREHLAWLSARAAHLHRRLDVRLSDLDCADLDLAAEADLLQAARMAKVLDVYLASYTPTPTDSSRPTAAAGPSQGALDPLAAAPTTAACSPRRDEGVPTTPAVSAADAAAGPGAAEVSSSSLHAPTGRLPSPAALHSLRCRLSAATQHLAAIEARHQADAYGLLRRYYFAPHEPLRAIALRCQQYRRHLDAAWEGCGPGSPELVELVEALEEAVRSRSLSGLGTFAELALRDQHYVEARRGVEPQAERGVAGGCLPSMAPTSTSQTGSGGGFTGSGGGGPSSGLGGVGFGLGPQLDLDALAAAAASDFAALRELRRELELVAAGVEAQGVPLGELLRLASG